MQALIVNPDLIGRIEETIIHAEANPVSMDDMLDTYNKQRPAVGDDLNHVVYMERDLRAVNSIEEQTPGMCRHVSISIDRDGQLPSVPIVEQIIVLFHFVSPLMQCRVWIEQIGPNRQAVNVLEIIPT